MLSSKTPSWLTMLIQLVRVDSADSNQGPVERNQQQQQKRFDNSQTDADAKHVARLKVAIGVTDDHDCRLVNKNFPAGGKCPDHAKRQRIKMVFCREVHQWRNRRTQHRYVRAQKNMIEERGPVGDKRQTKHVR